MRGGGAWSSTSALSAFGMLWSERR